MSLLSSFSTFNSRPHLVEDCYRVNFSLKLSEFLLLFFETRKYKEELI